MILTLEQNARNPDGLQVSWQHRRTVTADAEPGLVVACHRPPVYDAFECLLYIDGGPEGPPGADREGYAGPIVMIS